MENNKINKTNKKLVILCIILTIIIMGLVAFIVFSLGNKKTTLPQQNQQEQNQQEQSQVEIELTDSKIIEEISNKIEKIVYHGSKPAIQEFSLSQSYNSYGFRNEVLERILTKEEKLIITLLTTEWENLNEDSWKEYEYLTKNFQSPFKEYQKHVEGVVSTEPFLQTSVDNVKQNSIYLFNEEVDDTIEEIGACPTFYHKQNSKIYISWGACGGTSGSKINSYKSKFTSKNDEVYVYVNYAYLDTAGDGTYKIYKGIERKEENKLEYTVDENFMINETNYHIFSEYKFTFKKDTNNNYYFVGVEQTK